MTKHPRVTDTQSGEYVGKAAHRHGGAGFTSTITPEDHWQAVEQAVRFLLAESAAVGVNLTCGLTVWLFGSSSSRIVKTRSSVCEPWRGSGCEFFHEV